MEKKVKSIFEFQRFEGNPRLQKLIEETENRFARELADEDLWLVNAAGVPDEAIPSFEKEQKKSKWRN